ncbi:unnamed protein product [Zymoseptoria tritici ST99CH_3D1]|uniref:Beta/gamma crystallin 'Greek key' domain-containing protein n=1 Tax=Zymoseptoria tritici (strain ST99CH_3D7) TaxID=1276538 RepID=A0A1X7RQ43_ZYMT9|nr:unnamed protein product [Zymoseptoria tritici ST99CH_3D7]SMR51468.1 unnamed protein product [Zymoseptoria tritici ST99CH_3D1]
MKFSQLSTALLFAPAMAGLLSKRGVQEVPNPGVGDDIPKEAKEKFLSNDVKNLLFTKDAEARDDKKQDHVPKYLFVLMCREQGFRGECLVFGAAPGQCVNFYDFNTDGKTGKSYDKNITSLSSSYGDVCQFYTDKDCGFDNENSGVSLQYAYNLDISESGNTRPDDYDGSYGHNISSWRC